MLVKSCINYITIGIILCSIPILIYSIKNKDKSICKKLLILDTTYILYLFIITAILPSILGIDQGLEVLFTYLISFIAGIIYIISIIVCKKNTKKNNDIYSKSSKATLIMIVLIILPILLFFSSFLRECYLIKNSELIIESNYQNGFITSEDYRYAISEDYCEEVTITIPKSVNFKNIEHYTYYINFINNSDNYEIEENYIDKDLNHLDKTMAKKILLDAKNNHSNINKKFSNFDYIINSASITYFENSGYYYVSIGYDRNGNGGMSVVNEMIYKGDKYIGELLIHGDIESVKFYN